MLLLWFVSISGSFLWASEYVCCAAEHERIRYNNSFNSRSNLEYWRKLQKKRHLTNKSSFSWMCGIYFFFVLYKIHFHFYFNKLHQFERVFHSQRVITQVAEIVFFFFLCIWQENCDCEEWICKTNTHTHNNSNTVFDDLFIILFCRKFVHDHQLSRLFIEIFRGISQILLCSANEEKCAAVLASCPLFSLGFKSCFEPSRVSVPRSADHILMGHLIW